jgi:hypothetical protein
MFLFIFIWLLWLHRSFFIVIILLHCFIKALIFIVIWGEFLGITDSILSLFFGKGEDENDHGFKTNAIVNNSNSSNCTSTTCRSDKDKPVLFGALGRQYSLEERGQLNYTDNPPGGGGSRCVSRQNSQNTTVTTATTGSIKVLDLRDTFLSAEQGLGVEHTDILLEPSSFLSPSPSPSPSLLQKIRVKTPPSVGPSCDIKSSRRIINSRSTPAVFSSAQLMPSAPPMHPDNELCIEEIDSAATVSDMRKDKIIGSLSIGNTYDQTTIYAQVKNSRGAEWVEK